MTDADPPILYSFRRCPYAMRARMALGVSRQRCELREVVLRDKPPSMIEASEKGTVPVLVLPDGTVIDESLDVMRWALNENDPEHWLAPDTGEMMALVAESDGPFKHHLDRYKYSTRYEDADRLEHRAEGENFLRKLEARLEGHRFLFGDSPCLADVAIFPFIRQFRIADPEWFDASPFPALHAWLARCLELPAFKRAMMKYAQWAEGDAPIYYP